MVPSSLLVQCCENQFADVVDVANTGNLAVLRRTGFAAFGPVAIITDQYLGLVVVNLQTFAHCFFEIVGALEKFGFTDFRVEQHPNIHGSALMLAARKP